MTPFEQAIATMQAEVAQHGSNLDLSRRMELSSAVWKVANTEQRDAIRQQYADAGWKMCGHSACEPNHCTAKSCTTCGKKFQGTGAQCVWCLLPKPLGYDDEDGGD